MKVLFISTGDSKYGAPKSMLALMQLLKEKYDVDVVLLTKKHNSLNEFCDAHGIENFSCFYCDMMSGSNYESRYKNALKHIIKYVLYMTGEMTKSNVKKMGINFGEIDIIHSNTNRIDIGAYLSEQYNIPHVWHLREMDEGTKNMVYYKKNWSTYMNNHADSFIAITKAVKESWRKHGLDGNKIQVIYNGIDQTKIENRILREDGLLKIVVVGRVEMSKGQEDLIRAICILPEEKQRTIVVDFIGEAYAEYKKKLMRMMESQHCMAKINFLGYCKDVNERLKNYDVGITCSTAEAFGRTTVEYMMAGLLTIATDTGANPELISDGESGLLYRQGNAEKLAEIICGIMDKKYNTDELRESGKRRANSLFCAESNADKIYELYVSLKERA